MTKRLLGTGLLLAFLLPAQALAADLATPACIDDTYAALAKEQRLYRSVVFGAQKAKNLPVNSLLYDGDGKAWLKTQENEWAAVPEEGSSSSSGGKTRGDAGMDEASDTPVRRGLLQAKRTATSDIIPGITQSLRAFQCRLRGVCEALKASQDEGQEGKTVTVQPDGCIEMEFPVIRGCADTEGVGVALVDPSMCDTAADSLFKHESDILDLSVSYDASYRTVAQFAGMFEGFLSDFRFPLLNPLWQTVRTLGGLKNIPCFLSQCEE